MQRRNEHTSATFVLSSAVCITPKWPRRQPRNQVIYEFSAECGSCSGRGGVYSARRLSLARVGSTSLAGAVHGRTQTAACAYSRRDNGCSVLTTRQITLRTYLVLPNRRINPDPTGHRQCSFLQLNKNICLARNTMGATKPENTANLQHRAVTTISLPVSLYYHFCLSVAGAFLLGAIGACSHSAVLNITYATSAAARLNTTITSWRCTAV